MCVCARALLQSLLPPSFPQPPQCKCCCLPRYSEAARLGPCILASRAHAQTGMITSGLASRVPAASSVRCHAPPHPTPPLTSPALRARRCQS
eukprot:4782787-Pyramimonas_sp.AAC.1